MLWLPTERSSATDGFIVTAYLTRRPSQQREVFMDALKILQASDQANWGL